MANFLRKQAFLACYRSQSSPRSAKPTQTATQQPNIYSHGISSGTGWCGKHSLLQLQQVVVRPAIQRSVTKRRPQRGETNSLWLRTFTSCSVLKDCSFVCARYQDWCTYRVQCGCCSWRPTRPWSSSSPTSTFLSTASSWWLSHTVTTSSCWPKCTVLAPHFPYRHTVLVTGLLVAASPGLQKGSTGGGTTYRELSFVWLSTM